jgi:hypothetical protein
MKFTKETTKEQFLIMFEELGFYIPFNRVRGCVKQVPYLEATKDARAIGMPNARDYYRAKKEELSVEESELYTRMSK